MTSVEPPSGNEHAHLDAYRTTTAMPDVARDRVWARLAGGPLGPIGGEAANELGVGEATIGRGGGWFARPGLVIGAAVAVVTTAAVLGLRARGRSIELASPQAVVAADRRDRAASRVEQPNVPATVDESPSQRRVESIEPDDSPAPEPVASVTSKRIAARARAKPADAPVLRTTSLSAEGRLIERTHAALGRGETDVALALLRQHALEYEAGVFVEERESFAGHRDMYGWTARRRPIGCAQIPGQLSGRGAGRSGTQQLRTRGLS